MTTNIQLSRHFRENNVDVSIFFLNTIRDNRKMEKNNHTPAPDEGILQMFEGRFRPLMTTAVLYLAVSFVLRIVLWIAFGRHFDVVPLQRPVLLVSGGGQ